MGMGCELFFDIYIFNSEGVIQDSVNLFQDAEILTAFLTSGEIVGIDNFNFSDDITKEDYELIKLEISEDVGIYFSKIIDSKKVLTIFKTISNLIYKNKYAYFKNMSLDIHTKEIDLKSILNKTDAYSIIDSYIEGVIGFLTLASKLNYRIQFVSGAW